jgi:peroxiredoxin
MAMSSPKQPTDPAPARRGKIRQAAMALVALSALIAAGFSIWRQLTPKPFYQFDAATFAFVDHAQANCPLDGCDVEQLAFVGVDGQPVNLKQFVGQKNVVLIVTRGNTTKAVAGPYRDNICLYCATQTSRLIANYQAFQDQGAEVVVVYPIKELADKSSVGQFLESVRKVGATAAPPFPLVLDVGLQAVDQLGIRADLAKPATYIVDKAGEVRFAYVGATIADRPSVQSLLDQLGTINADAR